MKFLSSEKAVSEVIGHVIILGLAVTGVALITLIGAPSIYKLQDMAVIRNVEQGFTVLDSRASTSLIGDSPIQVTDMNPGDGILAVEPNGTGRESFMEIKSENRTFNITIPMGKVKYRLGERIVAYEGGGIWSKYPSGGSVMLSPPEFHYNGRTLTLPSITVNGTADIGGKGKASISFKKNTTVLLYPNTTVDPNRTNPLNYSLSGKVFVNITSDFYDAWADYARGLLYTKVSTNSTGHKASIELKVVPNTFGGLADYSNIINLRGLPNKDNPADNFSFRIKDSNFHNFNWQLTTYSGTKTLVFELKKGTDLNIGYRDTAQNPNNAEIWVKNDAFTVVDDNVDVDLLNASINLTYEGTIVGTDTPCANKMNSADIHIPAFSWSDRTINTTAGFNEESLYNITQHYIRLIAQSSGDATFSGCSPGGGHGPEPGSQMLIDYDAVGAITFLHISSNTADVSIS